MTTSQCYVCQRHLPVITSQVTYGLTLRTWEYSGPVATQGRTINEHHTVRICQDCHSLYQLGYIDVRIQVIRHPADTTYSNTTPTIQEGEH